MEVQLPERHRSHPVSERAGQGRRVRHVARSGVEGHRALAATRVERRRLLVRSISRRSRPSDTKLATLTPSSRISFPRLQKTAKCAAASVSSSRTAASAAARPRWSTARLATPSAPSASRQSALASRARSLARATADAASTVATHARSRPDGSRSAQGSGARPEVKPRGRKHRALPDGVAGCASAWQRRSAVLHALRRVREARPSRPVRRDEGAGGADVSGGGALRIAARVEAAPPVQSVKTGRPTTSSSAVAVALTQTRSPAVWHAAP